MSVFPPGEITFYRLVEQAFLLNKGSGLMLSPTDVELVRRWRAAGAPARVVVAAITDSFESFRRARGEGAAPPRSLSYCAPAVDDAIAAWRTRAVGHTRPEDA